MNLATLALARAYQVRSGRSGRPARALTLAGAELPDPEPAVVPTEAGPVGVQLYRAPHRGAAPEFRPVYLNFHGGGFVVRHPEFDDHICRALVARTGCIAVNVDYDVAPQRRFPVAHRQAYGVAAWAAHQGAAEHGWDGVRLAVGGQGAGGNLAAGLCLAARETRAFRPVLQILNHPATDLASSPSGKRARTPRPHIHPALATLMTDAYLPELAQRQNPLASPLLAPDLTGLPPALIITAELDSLRDEGDAYADRLARAGIPVTHHVMPGVDHGFTHYQRSALQEALDLMIAALENAWK